MAKQIVEMRVESVTDETPDIRTIKLRWPDAYDVSFKTGQFITVFFPADPKTKRAYSLSSCQYDRGVYEISVKRMGYFGALLYDTIKPGSSLMVIPPTGRFLLPEDPEADVLCVAGGSGITPFRGFARHFAHDQRPGKITIISSQKTPSDNVFFQEFSALAAKCKYMEYVVTLTRALPEHGWTGRTGRISEAMIAEFVRSFEKTHFYSCGPTALVEATEQLLLHQLQVPKPQVHTEKWG